LYLFFLHHFSKEYLVACYLVFKVHSPPFGDSFILPLTHQLVNHFFKLFFFGFLCCRFTKPLQLVTCSVLHFRVLLLTTLTILQTNGSYVKHIFKLFF